MRHPGQRLLLFTALFCASVLSLFPVFWMFVTAIRPAGEIFTRAFHLWPTHPAWQNLAHAWSTYAVGDWLVNSLSVTFFGSVFSVFIYLLAGYAFAKFEFAGRDALFLCYLATLMLPTQVLIVPQFMGIAAVGGVNHFWAVILPRAAEAYGVFLARQLLQSVPDELLDSARLEGAGEWSIFWRIVVPLSRPAIAVLSLMLSLGFWNDFGWPLIVLQDKSAMTLPVGLGLPQGQHVTDWASVMTIALVSVVPIVALFFALQRYFVQGFARTGLK